MWGTIITTLLPFAIKIITYIIDTKIQNKERQTAARKTFLSFVNQMEIGIVDNAALRKSVKSQKEKLQEVMKRGGDVVL